MTRYTSIEQAKHLLSLGLDPSSADMHYQYVLPKSDKIHHVPTIGEPVESLEWYNKGYTLGCKNKPLSLEEFCVPCWSLEALLDAMPKEITDEYDSKGSLGMCVCYNSSWEWVVYYSNADADCSSIHEEQGNTLLEAAYNMVYWLLEQGYIKKEA